MKRILWIVGLTAALFCLTSAAAVADVTIPAGTEVIESEAFMGSQTLGIVTLNNELKRIEERAFAGCEIWRINFPASLEYIADDAFDFDYYATGVETVSGTYAWRWAIDHHLIMAEAVEPVGTDRYLVSWEKAEDISVYDVRVYTDSGCTQLFAGFSIEGDDHAYVSTEPGVQYYFVIAYEYDGQYLVSSTLSPAPVTPLPAPENASAVMQDEETALITWDPIPGAAGYRVYYSRDPEWNMYKACISQISDTSLTLSLPGMDEPLAGDTVEEGDYWYFWICAEDSDGPHLTAGTSACATPCPRPTGAGLDGYNTDFYWIWWDLMPGATGYRIYWSETDAVSANSAFTEFGPENDFTFFVVSPGETRYFALSALYADGESALTSVMTDTLPEAMPAPGNARVESVDADGIVRLAWDAVPGAVNYRIFFSPQPEYDQNNYHISTGSDGTSYAFDPFIYGCSNERLYFWITVQTDIGPGYPSERVAADIPSQTENRLTVVNDPHEATLYILPADLEDTHIMYRNVGFTALRIADYSTLQAHFGAPISWDVQQISGEPVGAYVEDISDSYTDDDYAACILWFSPDVPSQPGDTVYRITAQCGTASASCDFTCHYGEADLTAFEGMSISPAEITAAIDEVFTISASAPGLSYTPSLLPIDFSGIGTQLTRYTSPRGTQSMSISAAGDYTLTMYIALPGNLSYRETIAIHIPAGEIEPESGVFGIDGDNLTWELAADGTLTIRGTGAMPDARFYSDYPWASHVRHTDIRSVVIEEGVTNIGNYAFYGLQGLVSVSIPSGVTQIGRCAFMSDIRLADLTLPEGLQEIDASAFYYCNALTHATLPASLTVMNGNPFGSCKGLLSIEVSAGNPMFMSEDGVLFSADGVTLITYPAGKPASSYTVPGSVMVIADSAFFGAYCLESVRLQEGIILIGGSAFHLCEFLSEISLPEGLLTIGDFAFSDTAVSVIHIPASVTAIGHGAFASGSVTAIQAADDNTAYASVDGVLFSKDLSLLHSYPSGNNAASYTIPNSVTRVEMYAFRSLRFLESLIIPTSVTEMDSYSFDGYSALSDIYYTGTQAQWDAIEVPDLDDSFLYGITLHTDYTP